MRRIGLLAAMLSLTIAAPAGATFVPAQQIDSAATVHYGGIALAADGTGALTYLKQVGADQQVWVSTLQNGTWSAPQRVDTGLSGSQIDPVVAAAAGGRVLVTFMTAGAQKLDAVLRANSGGSFSSPAVVRDAGAGNVIQFDATTAMGPTGVAYSVWCEGAAGQGHARAARLAGTAWTPVAQPIDSGNFIACEGSNIPDVGIGVDGSGNAVAIWNEQDTVSHPFARRLTGTTQGPLIDLRATTLFGHTNQDFGDMVNVAVASDGSAWTVHRGFYDYGGMNFPRTVARYIPAGSSTPGPAQVFDGLPTTGLTQGAERPWVALNATGQGLYASDGQLTHETWAGSMSAASVGSPQRIDAPGAADAATEAVQPAIGNSGLGAIGWFNAPSAAGSHPQIVARAWNGASFSDPPAQISSGAFGDPTWDTFTRHTAADDLGDVVFGFSQSDGTTARIVVAALAQPPTPPVGTTTTAAQQTLRPVLSWTPSQELYGGITQYRLLVDGTQIGTAGAAATSFTPAADIPAGAHSWQVVAVDANGQTTASAARTLLLRTPTSPPPGSTLTPSQLAALIGTRPKASHGKATVGTVKCPPVCGHVTIKVTTVIRVHRKGHSQGFKRTRVKIGSGSFAVGPGQTVVLKFKLNSRGRKLLRRHRKLRIRLEVTVTGASGHAVTVRKDATLRAPRGRKHKHKK